MSIHYPYKNCSLGKFLGIPFCGYNRHAFESSFHTKISKLTNQIHPSKQPRPSKKVTFTSTSIPNKKPTYYSSGKLTVRPWKAPIVSENQSSIPIHVSTISNRYHPADLQLSEAQPLALIDATCWSLHVGPRCSWRVASIDPSTQTPGSFHCIVIWL